MITRTASSSRLLASPSNDGQPQTRPRYSRIALVLLSMASVDSFAPSLFTTPRSTTATSGFAPNSQVERTTTTTTTTTPPVPPIFGGYSHAETSRGYANSATLDRPYHAYRDFDDDSSDGRMSDFQRRMRKLVQHQESARRKTPPNRPQKPGDDNKTNGGGRPRNIQDVYTIDEYKKVVAEEKERIVVVRFYATWCRSCKAVQPAFYRMARNNPGVLFVEVPISEHNADLHQRLGVPSVPFVHIYIPDKGSGSNQLVEELRASRKVFKRVEQALEWYVSGSCELPDGDPSNPYEEVALQEA